MTAPVVSFLGSRLWGSCAISVSADTLLAQPLIIVSQEGENQEGLGCELYHPPTILAGGGGDPSLEALWSLPKMLICMCPPPLFSAVQLTAASTGAHFMEELCVGSGLNSQS